MLTQSYRKNKDGSITLSGKCYGIEGRGKELLEAFKNKYQKGADVYFMPVNEAARQLVCQSFDVEYVENEEAYIIDIDDVVTVYADSERAKLYAAVTLQDAFEESLQKAVIYNYPAVAHRSARVYLPAKKDMPYFKKFIDMLVYLGYNSLLLEIGGAMEYKKHPEINSTWKEYCASMNEFNDKCYVAQEVYYRTKNSIHTFNGGGDIYSQEELKELAMYCSERYIEIIPEVPSLSHSEYILISHPELRECEDEPFASTACPSNPDLYKLVFDLYDEVIEVFSPKTIHIGHDEWYNMCLCDRCRDKEAGVLLAENVLKCYNYLKQRGIRTMMWAEKLIQVIDKRGEVHGGGERHIFNLKTDKTIEVMGKEYPLYERHYFQPTKEAEEHGFEQVIPETISCMDAIPDDLICVNWYWSLEPRIIDEFLLRGKTMIYGNCKMAGMTNCKDRFAAGAQGVSISCWHDSSEAGMQRWNTQFDLGYGAAVCWGHNRKENEHEKNLADTFAGLYRFRNRETLAGSYIEVVHTLKKAWEDGEKYYSDLPYADEKNMTLGEYAVQYEDGSSESFPVLYTLNIGTGNAVTERWSSAISWSYALDKHLTTVASVCDFEKREDGVWYKTVFPTRGNVVTCKYIPKDGLEEYVAVKEIEIVNK